MIDWQRPAVGEMNIERLKGLLQMQLSQLFDGHSAIVAGDNRPVNEQSNEQMWLGKN